MNMDLFSSGDPLGLATDEPKSCFSMHPRDDPLMFFQMNSSDLDLHDGINQFPSSNHLFPHYHGDSNHPPSLSSSSSSLPPMVIRSYSPTMGLSGDTMPALSNSSTRRPATSDSSSHGLHTDFFPQQDGAMNNKVTVNIPLNPSNSSSAASSQMSSIHNSPNSHTQSFTLGNQTAQYPESSVSNMTSYGQNYYGQFAPQSTVQAQYYSVQPLLPNPSNFPTPILPNQVKQELGNSNSSVRNPGIGSTPSPNGIENTSSRTIRPRKAASKPSSSDNEKNSRKRSRPSSEDDDDDESDSSEASSVTKTSFFPATNGTANVPNRDSSLDLLCDHLHEDDDTLRESCRTLGLVVPDAFLIGDLRALINERQLKNQRLARKAALAREARLKKKTKLEQLQDSVSEKQETLELVQAASKQKDKIIEELRIENAKLLQMISSRPDSPQNLQQKIPSPPLTPSFPVATQGLPGLVTPKLVTLDISKVLELQKALQGIFETAQA